MLNVKTKLTKLALGAAVMGVSGYSQAVDLEVSVQNLTQGIYFAPLLVTAHSPDQSLFELGEEASAEIQAMAEGGDISGLEAIADAISANTSANPNEGPLGPAESTTAMVYPDEGNTVLSIVGMIVPSNDGFIGLDNWTIPEEPGTYTLYLNGYDAGTEVNDEVRGSGMPGEPGLGVPPFLEDKVGFNATGVTSTLSNNYIHVHPGSLGDDDLEGGVSDLDNAVFRWLNPVAKVTIVVTE